MEELISFTEINSFNQKSFLIKRILKEQAIKLYFDIQDIKIFRNVSELLRVALQNQYEGFTFLVPPNGNYTKMPILDSFILYNYASYEIFINMIAFAFTDFEKGDLLLKELIKISTQKKIKIYSTLQLVETGAIELCINNEFVIKETINVDSFKYIVLEFSP